MRSMIGMGVLNRDPGAGAAQLERLGEIVGRLDVLGEPARCRPAGQPSQALPFSTGRRGVKPESPPRGDRRSSYQDVAEVVGRG